MDLTEFINNEITCFVCRNANYSKHPLLVKKNTEQLDKVGDFGFPLNSSIWQKHLGLSNNESISESRLRLTALMHEETIEQKPTHEELIERSREWPTPLAKVRVQSDRCLLYLHRLTAIQYALKSVHSLDMFQNLKFDSCIQSVHFKQQKNDPAADLNAYRAKLISLVLKNLATYTMRTEREPQESSIIVEVKPIKYKIAKQAEEEIKQLTIFCGNVTDEEHKVAKIHTSDYINLRAKDMQLMAMHKYGVRVKNEECFRKLISQLGDSAVKVDLLENKHSSPISVKRNGRGCTKGASFILYNSARIETLLRTFEDRVRNGVYPNLPQVDELDISLLNEEEEWKLVFNFILAFPNLIKRCLEGLEVGHCSPHLLLQFLCALVSEFSVYYRRVRILLDGRGHLIPVIHARMFLVKCIREVLNRILAILDIDPIQHM